MVFAALIALPFVFTAPWVQDLFFFTLMYAALASAWNIVGGYSGYISLGHAAFFGIGAYAIGILFTHISIGDGYRPFYVLPLVGLSVAIVAVPMGWIAYRTRAATFAIVTITLLFLGQQLAFNLRSVTGAGAPRCRHTRGRRCVTRPGPLVRVYRWAGRPDPRWSAARTACT